MFTFLFIFLNVCGTEKPGSFAPIINFRVQISEFILDYVCNKWVHKTNLKSVDTLLFGMYARIKEQHDNPEKFGLSSLIINS